MHSRRIIHTEQATNAPSTWPRQTLITPGIRAYSVELRGRRRTAEEEVSRFEKKKSCCYGRIQGMREPELRTVTNVPPMEATTQQPRRRRRPPSHQVRPIEQEASSRKTAESHFVVRCGTRWGNREQPNARRRNRLRKSRGGRASAWCFPATGACQRASLSGQSQEATTYRKDERDRM